MCCSGKNKNKNKTLIGSRTTDQQCESRAARDSHLVMQFQETCFEVCLVPDAINECAQWNRTTTSTNSSYSQMWKFSGVSLENISRASFFLFSTHWPVLKESIFENLTVMSIFVYDFLFMICKSSRVVKMIIWLKQKLDILYF